MFIIPTFRSSLLKPAGGGGGLATFLNYGSPIGVWSAENYVGGSSVSDIVDDTGNGYDAISSFGGTSTYSATSFDGMPGFTVSTLNQGLSIPTIAFATSSAWTIVAFAQCTGDSQIMGELGNTLRQVRRDRVSGNNMALNFGTLKIGANTSPVNHSDIQMIVWGYDGANVFFRCNKTDTTSTATGDPGLVRLDLIFRYNVAHWQGTIAMLGIWNEDLIQSVTDQIYDEVGVPRYPSLP